ncbi:hypothetical protein M2171_002599 [Bradyrhizobium japonicum USDA 38]|uniref:hypothetical protein n=1 Tax=Bradyrhizobium japonicum TaxID=375 RepID=UPI000402340F|nr:hypothetical protein [Bradyrhizobium japonicum]MCS3893466.1 hypothetical protein [Bradyrhizobium japonicum USDA 38]MCS3945980.1 hypothetical protein [Bradyrhizobium japonicum]
MTSENQTQTAAGALLGFGELRCEPGGDNTTEVIVNLANFELAKALGFETGKMQ